MPDFSLDRDERYIHMRYRESNRLTKAIQISRNLFFTNSRLVRCSRCLCCCCCCMSRAPTFFRSMQYQFIMSRQSAFDVSVFVHYRDGVFVCVSHYGFLRSQIHSNRNVSLYLSFRCTTPSNLLEFKTFKTSLVINCKHQVHSPNEAKRLMQFELVN